MAADRFPGVDGDDAAVKTATIDLINILDTVDVPIVVLRRDLVLVCFNKAAADVLRFSPLDVVGRPRFSALAGLPRLKEHAARSSPARRIRADVRDGDKWFVLRIRPHGRRSSRHRHRADVHQCDCFPRQHRSAIYEREYAKAILTRFRSLCRY